MATIVEGNLTFDFRPHWITLKYDASVFHVVEFAHVCGGSRAIDIFACEPAGCCWLIEIKDHRRGHRTTAVALAELVAAKVRDSLAGLATARVRALGGERQAADDCLRCQDLRIVLHLEQPPATSSLRAVAINSANVLQRMRQLVKAIDRNPQVVDISGSAHLPWTVH